MDSRNFVAPRGNGWVVYRDGKEIGFYPTQQQAEQAYNAYGGVPPAGPPAPGAGGYGDGYSGSNWEDVLKAMAGSNQEEFDYRKKHDAQVLLANLMEGLLGTSASLRGPRDWLKYQEYTGGGRGLMNQVFGGNVPSFTSPSGTSEAITIEDILRDLGLMPGGGAGGGGTTGGGTVSEDEIQAWNRNMKQDIRIVRAFIAKYGRLPSSLSEWVKYRDTEYQPGQAATPTGAGDAQTQAAMGQSAQMANQRIGVGDILPGQPGPGSQVPLPPGGPTPMPVMGGNVPPQQEIAPLPWQFNPGVWEQWGRTQPSAQQMILGMVESGKAEGGAWDPSDWLAKMYASRPQGTARRGGAYYSKPRSWF